MLEELEVESDNSWETESDSDSDSEDSITVSRKRKLAKRLSSSDSAVVDTSSNSFEEWIWEDKDNRTKPQMKWNWSKRAIIHTPFFRYFPFSAF